jgi:hypothetical protein
MILPIIKDEYLELGLLNPEKYKESPTMIESFFIPILESEFSRFVESKKAEINTFLYWQEKIEEIKYRTKPHFTLSVVKNRNTKSILARVKWVYKFKGKVKKSPYLSIYIGSITQYPKGLKDSQLFYDAPVKIQEYLNKECPIEF